MVRVRVAVLGGGDLGAAKITKLEANGIGSFHAVVAAGGHGVDERHGYGHERD